MGAPFRELVLRHSGRPIAVLGGGPSLPTQVGKLPPGCILISVNEHGQKLMPCDYVVAIDGKADHKAKLLALGVPTITPFSWSTYTTTDQPTLFFSSQLAAWLGWLMGGYPIILCGMDLYRGGTYWHDLAAKSSGTYRTTEGHLKGWQATRDVVPAQVRVTGGLLSSVFPIYTQTEILPPYVEPERARLLQVAGGSIVRIRLETRVAGQLLRPGDIVELPRATARKLVAQRRATLQGVPV